MVVDCLRLSGAVLTTGDGSCFSGDPSLRLKSGSARYDAGLNRAITPQ